MHETEDKVELGPLDGPSLVPRLDTFSLWATRKRTYLTSRQPVKHEYCCCVPFIVSYRYGVQRESLALSFTQGVACPPVDRVPTQRQ